MKMIKEKFYLLDKKRTHKKSVKEKYQILSCIFY
jgi:hypothetical protein